MGHVTGPDRRGALPVKAVEQRNQVKGQNGEQHPADHHDRQRLLRLRPHLGREGGREQAEGDAAAPAGLEQQEQQQGGEDDEAAAAIPPAVCIPGFLAAVGAMAGAEAEEDDYDA